MSPWVVDTCVVVDVAKNDTRHGECSALALQQRLDEGLLIAPVTFAELSPIFLGDQGELRVFLELSRIDWRQPWTIGDTETAFDAWWRYVKAKRIQQVAKRPIADILIGAYACRFRGLITRNPKDFTPFFPHLEVIDASA